MRSSAMYVLSVLLVNLANGAFIDFMTKMICQNL